jgi:hypothetical protein
MTSEESAVLARPHDTSSIKGGNGNFSQPSLLLLVIFIAIILLLLEELEENINICSD